MRPLIPSRTFSRVSAIQLNGTLIPFLYQTTTIQQWINPRIDRSRRRITTKVNHIPFERSDEVALPVGIPLEDAKSTISGQEKQIFNKLLDPSFDPKAALRKGKAGPSKSKVLGEKRKPTVRDKQVRPHLQFRDADLEKKHAELAANKGKANRLAQAQANKVLQAKFVEETDELKQWREGLLATATAAFQNAKTDQELWTLLEKYAFEGVRKQLRDSHDIQQATGKSFKESRKKNSKATPTSSTTEPPESNLAVLIHTYPLLLIQFLYVLRSNFSTSPLAFSLLPTIKSLGRQSYVLAASTSLYNGLLEAHWQTYEFSRIDELLLEMENAGLEFEYETLEILERMKKQGDNVLKGRKGVLVQQVWEMDKIGEGWRKVVGWIPKVQIALEAEALRKAGEIGEEGEWQDEEASPVQVATV